jgi:predicted MPP superfamily phosphohydrolase
MAFAVFFLVALSVLYFAHYFLYVSIVHFFAVSGGGRKLTLALIIFLLPTSFIAVEILARRTANLFFNALFFSSTLWLGVAATLLTFFVVAWVLWGASRLLTHSPSPALFGWAAVVLAGLYSGYGVWNARHPRIEDVTVKIRNLPSAWSGRKAVLLSDVHLGHILGAPFLEDLVQKINAQEPAIVFIVGDLFDGGDGNLDALVHPLNSLKAPLGTYFVTGNHETYLGVERAYAALATTPAKVLRDEMVVIDGLQIIGVSYPERGFSRNLAEVLANLPGFKPRQMPSLLLYHNPTAVEEAKKAGISLQLSGHTHHGQIFPIQFISRLIYGKYYYGLHVEGDYTIYTSSGAGTWGPMMRTGNHPEIAVIHLEAM